MGTGAIGWKLQAEGEGRQSTEGGKGKTKKREKGSGLAIKQFVSCPAERHG